MYSRSPHSVTQSISVYLSLSQSLRVSLDAGASLVVAPLVSQLKSVSIIAAGNS